MSVSKHKTQTIVPPEDLPPLVTIEEWHQQQRANAHRTSSIDQFLHPFWRSMAVNVYDLLDTEKVNGQIHRFLAGLFGKHWQKRIHQLVNLRLKTVCHAQQTPELLETFLFADSQFDDVGNKACAVVTLSIDVGQDARNSLQLRSPSFPIGAQAGFTEAFESASAQAIKKRQPVATRSSDKIQYSKYSVREKRESALLAQFITSGELLYDELRCKKQFETIAMLVAECAVKADKEADMANERAEQQREKKMKKRKKKTAAGAEDDDDDAVDDDRSDKNIVVADGASLSAASPSTSSSSSAASTAPAAAAAAATSVKPRKPEMSAVTTTSEDDGSGGSSELPELKDDDASSSSKSFDDDDVHISSASEDEHVANNIRQRKTLRKPTAVSRKGRRGQKPTDVASLSDDDDDDDDDLDDKVAVKRSRKPKEKTTELPEPKTRRGKPVDVEPHFIEIRRPDELQWIRMVVAQSAFILCIKLSCLAPNAADLKSVCKIRTIPIEVGVSRIPYMFARRDAVNMTFHIANIADLSRLKAISKANKAQSVAERSAPGVPSVVDTADDSEAPLSLMLNVDSTAAKYISCSTGATITVPAIKPLVAAPAAPVDYRDEKEAAVIPERHLGALHPLDDISAIDQNVADLTLYELTCYTRQRLMVLLAAYRGYHVSKSETERQIYVDAIARSQYPMRSGASYYMLRTIPQAREHELMHEGIAIAVLCLIAKHSSALFASLLIMEMCFVKHRFECKAREFARRDDIEASDAQDDALRDAYLENLVSAHVEKISDFYNDCDNVFTDEWQKIAASEPESETYTEFFQILRDMAGDWHEALADIADGAANEVNSDDEQNADEQQIEE